LGEGDGLAGEATGPPDSYPDRTFTGKQRRSLRTTRSAATSRLHLLLCQAHKLRGIGASSEAPTQMPDHGTPVR